MSRRLAPAPRGLTLIELVIGLGVSAIAIAAAMSLLVQQQRSYTTTAGDRAQQEAARMALQEIVSRLRHAGYGVDPALAFDFGQTASVPRANLMPPGTSVRQDSYLCNDPVRCRDSETGSDEVVFHTRLPSFSRPLTGVGTDEITVRGESRLPYRPGQILQVSCLGGSQTRAYVTVGTFVAGVSAPDPGREVTIPLQPSAGGGGVTAFPAENEQLADGCFGLSGGAVEPQVTRVERFRFFVAWYDESGAVQAPQTAGARPWLMLDRGTLDQDGNPLLVPVAPDVEDLQLAYLYPPAAAGGGHRVVGATEGVNAADEAFAITTGVVPPAIDDPPDAAARTTGHPANIVAVRVSVVVRAADVDIALRDADATAVPRAGNRAAFVGVRHSRRALFETTVTIPNMQSQAFVFPLVNAAGGEGVNLGGG